MSKLYEQSPTAVIYKDHMGDDNSVVNAARVSFSKDASNFTPEQNNKLIKYLAKHNHWTPFAHAFVTLHIKAPIAIHAQCVKHQVGFAMNTVSRRYVSEAPDYYLPIFRSKPIGSVKQGSGDEIAGAQQSNMQTVYTYHMNTSIDLYERLLENGVAPEQARFVLPQGVMTEWVWSGSLVAWARFYNQRIDPHAQKEIQELALKVGEIIEPLFPVAWEALTRCVWHDKSSKDEKLDNGLLGANCGKSA
ncbi:FAD-dependent thymidylate synthase [Moraxella catarrhalis]|uniref:FAD-dependent thymidylate synthase n=1 Tax=Moraxella catarrhalis TaxID=480 RepID=UPI000EA8EBE3|nr:FAD-dependent thymidylate synthase [Moraxella catarrhalis]RKM33446.1 FAD-dependent thymidylate synthase [Moraxella catarrhalis]